MTREDEQFDTLLRAVAASPSVSPRQQAVIADRFVICSPLGAGTFGEVFEAEDQAHGKRVALKLLREARPEWIYRFKREFRSLRGLMHRNLVAFDELFFRDGRWFFTMELVRGRDLLSYVRNRKSTAWEQTADMLTPEHATPGIVDRPDSHDTCDVARLRDVMLQLATGVAFLHGAGKLHRDLKPSNVLIEDTGRVVVLDLGLAYDLDEQQSVDGFPVGTIAYMSPEQAACGRVGPESDWYSVGAILYEALTGRLPHAGTAHEILRNKQRMEPVAPGILAPSIPSDLDELCRRLLQTDPRQRPTGEEILTRLGGDRPTSPPVRATTSAASTTPFVGRDEELATLHEAHAAVAAGRPSIVVIHGDSGVGKSALVRHFTEALPSDTLVLAGRCYERESVPYRALDAIVDAVSGHMARLPAEQAAALLPRMAPFLAQLFPVLSRVEAIARSPRPHLNADPHELRRRGFEALRELLARLSDRQRIVMLVDDLHWADADSLQLLDAILREPEAPTMMFIGIARSLPTVGEWLQRAVVLQIPVLPPSEAYDLATLLVKRIGAGDEVDAAAVARAADGHPLFIDTLIRHLSAEPVTPRVGVELNEAIWSQVKSLPADAQCFLETLCVASTPLHAAVAMKASELAGERATAAMTQLRLGNLLRVNAAEEVEAYHDRVRETVLAHLTADTLRMCHQRLAVVLESEPNAPPEALAIHWRGSGDNRRAASFARRAADEGFAALAFARAARFYQLAIDWMPEDDESRVVLLRRLGDSFANLGRGREAANAYFAARDLSSEEAKLELHRLGAEYLLTSGYLDEGIASLRQLLERVGMSFPKTQRRALLTALSKRAWLGLRGFGYDAKPEQTIDRDLLARVDVCESTARGLATVDIFRSMVFSTSALTLALKSGEPKRIAVTLSYFGCMVAYQGGTRATAKSKALLESAAQAAASSDDAHARTYVAGSHGVAAIAQGHFRTALEILGQVEREYREQHPGAFWEINGARAMLLTAYYCLGETEELQRYCLLWLREAEERGDIFLRGLVSTGMSNMAWLVLDDPAQARERARVAMEPWQHCEYQRQHYLGMEADCNVDIYMDDPATALERLERDTPAIRRLMILHSEFLGIHYRELRARASLGAAARMPDGRVRRMLLGRTRGDGAWIHRTQARWGAGHAHLIDASLSFLDAKLEDAARALRNASDAFQDSDMALHAAAARWRLGELEGGDEGARKTMRAREFMTDRAIRAPERMLRLLSPAFSSPAP